MSSEQNKYEELYSVLMANVGETLEVEIDNSFAAFKRGMYRAQQKINLALDGFGKLPYALKFDELPVDFSDEHGGKKVRVSLVDAEPSGNFSFRILPKATGEKDDKTEQEL